jgi:UDP-N-acetylbacillosamine alanyltransferase
MRIDVEAARTLFDRLPRRLRLASLSPDYVLADARRLSGSQTHFWRYEEGERFWYHGFHLTPLPEVDGFDIQSPYGYGGPLANTADEGFLARAWRAHCEMATATGVAAEFVRFHPLAGNTSFFGGSIEENRQTVWIDLTARDLFSQYQGRSRTTIRKAQASGVRFAWQDLPTQAARFADFYRAGISALEAAHFYCFPDGYFSAMATWPCARLGVCSLDEQWLSAGLFLQGAECIEYHLAASSGVGKRLGAGSLLLHAAASSARDDGLGRLYLGGGTDGSAANSLYFYKGGFSPHRAAFYVGTHCHDAARHERLRQRWPQLHRANPERLLFYR